MMGKIGHRTAKVLKLARRRGEAVTERDLGDASKVRNVACKGFLRVVGKDRFDENRSLYQLTEKGIEALEQYEAAQASLADQWKGE